MDAAIMIGGLASLASVASFVPQAWKGIATRDTRSLSAPTYALTTFGFALWLIYGILLGQWPLIITNGICLALAAFILTMKLLPKTAVEAVAGQLDPRAD